MSMATLKRINDTYTINAPQVIIDGNFTVLGSTTSVETNNTTIKDNIIVLNQGETGNGITLGTSGITVDRGGVADVSLVYLHSSNVWSISNDGVTYSAIATIGGGGFLTNVVDDLSPELGGNLDVTSFSIVSSIGNVTIDSTMRLVSMSGSEPTVQPTDSTLLYANGPGPGGTGLYVNNNQMLQQELITKTRAFGFSLIL
jgi:hypothetical protein